jgi:hypothetical protein
MDRHCAYVCGGFGPDEHEGRSGAAMVLDETLKVRPV